MALRQVVLIDGRCTADMDISLLSISAARAHYRVRLFQVVFEFLDVIWFDINGTNVSEYSIAK